MSVESVGIDSYENNDFLIGAWSCITENMVTTKDDVYKNFSNFNNAGYNFTGLLPIQDNDKLDWIFEALENFDIKFMLESCDDYDKIDEISITNKISRYCKHQNCIGVFLKDEPSISDFNNILKVKNIYVKYLPKEKIIISNLFPNYANLKQLGIIKPNEARNKLLSDNDNKSLMPKYEEYFEYVEKYVKTVKPKVLCYDHYCISHEFRTDDYSRERLINKFVENLSIISNIAKNNNIPFWNVIQALGFLDNMLAPNMYEYRWMANFSYVLGAKSVLSFIYRNHYVEGGSFEKWENAPVTFTGKKTFEYNVVKSVNLGLISYVGNVFSFDYLGVCSHNLPCFILNAITDNLFGDKPFNISKIHGDMQAIISCMKKDNLHGIMVMNTSFYDSNEVDFIFSNTQDYNIWGITGIEKVARGNNFSISLEKGEAKFICYKSS